MKKKTIDPEAKLVIEIPFRYQGKDYSTKAILITNTTASGTIEKCYMIPSGSVLDAIRAIWGKVKFIEPVVHGNIIISNVACGPEQASGSCRIADTLDPAGVAMRRSIGNLALQLGCMTEAFEKLREINGRTLDPETSDTLNESVNLGF